MGVEDGVGLRPLVRCYIDTHDGLVFAKTPRWDLRGVDGRRLETPVPFYLGPMCVT